jgi:two-component system, NarL family, sensor kinase
VSGGAAARVTLRRLVLLTVVLGIAASALLVIGISGAARAEARRTAEQSSEQLATALVPVLAQHDFTTPDEAGRSVLLGRLAPYLGPGIIYRIKVWSVDAGSAQIVFSDEERVQGERRPLDPTIIDRTSAGGVFVMAVPDDAEHRYEIEQAGHLLEVFTGFTDAAGHDHLMELYLPVATADTARNTAAYVVPLGLGGFMVIGLILIVVAYALARRLDRGRDEHRDALRYGLAAEELARRELAQRLHDDVLPELASAGLLLDAVDRETGPGPDGADLLVRVRGMIRDDVRRIRGLLDELAPTAPAGQGLAGIFEELAGRVAGVPTISVSVEPGIVLGDAQLLLLYRSAGELLRNISRHADASSVAIDLRADEQGTLRFSVTDDGAGFEAESPAEPGHVGLTLVRRAVAEVGGRLDIDSTPGVGTDAVITVPQPGREAPEPPKSERGRARRPRRDRSSRGPRSS